MRTLDEELRARGYCCTYAALKMNRRLNSAALAQHFGVSRRTIQEWKSRIKSGHCECEDLSNCKKLRGGL